MIAFLGLQVLGANQGPIEQSIEFGPSPGSEGLGPPFQADFSLNCEAGHGLVGGYRETTPESVQDIAKARSALPHCAFQELED